MAHSIILVPLDGSALAMTAVADASAVALSTGADLLLLQVVPPRTHYGYCEPMAWPAELPPAQSDAHAAAIAYAYDELNRLARCLQLRGVSANVELVEGEPAQMIVARAQSDPAITMIAMATHGRRGLRRWMHGSVAERVLDNSPVPVLLVRQPAHVRRTAAARAPLQRRRKLAYVDD